MNLNDYITDLNKAYQVGNATEHTYRKYLQDLVESIDPTVIATNEPARIKCGAPDYIITKKDIPLGYIEAKDIGRLNKLVEAEKRQFARYTESLDNLIYTDYIEFVFYKAGQEVSRIKIGEVVNGALKPLPENFATFTTLIKDFINYHGATIKSAKQLAKMMAGKARLMSIVINNALVKTDDDYKNQTLKEHLEAFKQILIHDIEPAEFANVYSQTIAYGMFSARLHDTTLDTFSRQEAAELIPKSNPFLRKLFGYIAGPDLDDRIKWVVDSLAEIFSYTNVAEIMKNYGKSTKQTDPVIHFYETFLGEFDPALRKARGVWYTPDPIVQFIVRAVDEVLKTEFNLPMGLADTSKTTIDLEVKDGKLKKGFRKVQKEVHKVQILDPATGTGTFLAETIKQIHSNFEGQQGIWNTYVDKHLKPRLHGFELLMASYAMAHLKLDLLLKETGYSSKSDKRLNIYLTNSLEEAHPDTGTLFANWLSNEANEANYIKREVPVMVVMGNPPYSGVSSNNGKWISDLIDEYKFVDGKHFGERKHWLNDDYVKFIRYSEHFIEKNGQGVVGFITNHGYLDNPTFRGMRQHLMKTFDKIYIVDLHGNSLKKETTPSGGKDENVFDIMAGVSIIIAVKNPPSLSPTPCGRVKTSEDVLGRGKTSLSPTPKSFIPTPKSFIPAKAGTQSSNRPSSRATTRDLTESTSPNKTVIANHFCDSKVKQSAPHRHCEKPATKQSHELVNSIVRLPRSLRETARNDESNLATIYHKDLYGRRKEKYNYCESKSLSQVDFKTLKPKSPYYFFVPKNTKGQKEYEKGFSLKDLFPVNVTGIVTMGDSFIIAKNKNILKKRLEKFLEEEISESELKNEFTLGKNYAKWIIENKKSIKLNDSKFVKIDYRPFDTRWTYFDNKLLWRWREKVMKHMFNHENIALSIGRQGQVVGGMQWNLVSITNKLMDFNFYYRGGELIFPLYIYEAEKKDLIK